MLHQPFPHGIQVHVFQPLLEFPFVTHKAIPKLVLPQGSLTTPRRVKPERRDLLDVVQHLGDQQRILRPDQGVPMLRQQNIAAQQEHEPTSRSLQHVDDQRVFARPEWLDSRPEVNADKEDAIREAQTMNV